MRCDVHDRKDPQVANSFRLRGIAAVVIATTGIVAMSACGETDSGDSGSDSGTGTESSTSKDAGSEDATADVSTPALVVEGDPAFASYYAEVTVTNNSEERSDYKIVIVAESADGVTTIGEATTYITGLEPGEVKTDRAMFYVDIPADAVLRTSEVHRDASF
jgi:hypothetical protein